MQSWKIFRHVTLCFACILHHMIRRRMRERKGAVQSLKLEGVRELVHAGMSPPLWFHAVSHAAFLSRQRALGIELPKEEPKMGQLVAIKRHDHEAFEQRTLQGVAISRDDDRVQGAFVLTRHKGSLKLHRARMPVRLNQERNFGSALEAPDRGARVWL